MRQCQSCPRPDSGQIWIAATFPTSRPAGREDRGSLAVLTTSTSSVPETVEPPLRKRCAVAACCCCPLRRLQRDQRPARPCLPTPACAYLATDVGRAPRRLHRRPAGGTHHRCSHLAAVLIKRIQGSGSVAAAGGVRGQGGRQREYHLHRLHRPAGVGAGGIGLNAWRRRHSSAPAAHQPPAARIVTVRAAISFEWHTVPLCKRHASFEPRALRGGGEGARTGSTQHIVSASSFDAPKSYEKCTHAKAVSAGPASKAFGGHGKGTGQQQVEWRL